MGFFAPLPMRGVETLFVSGCVAGSLKETLGVLLVAPPISSAGPDTAEPIEPGAGAAARIGAFSSSSTGSGGATGSGLKIASVAPTPFCGRDTPGLMIGFTGVAIGGTGELGDSCGTGGIGETGDTGADGPIGVVEEVGVAGETGAAATGETG